MKSGIFGILPDIEELCIRPFGRRHIARGMQSPGQFQARRGGESRLIRHNAEMIDNLAELARAGGRKLSESPEVGAPYATLADMAVHRAKYKTAIPARVARKCHEATGRVARRCCAAPGAFAGDAVSPGWLGRLQDGMRGA